jgi:hypothetical protein
VHDNKLIEELKQQNERGKANLRRKKCIGSDRLHNIKATGNNNSEEMAVAQVSFTPSVISLSLDCLLSQSISPVGRI